MTLETLIPLYGGFSLARAEGTIFVRGAIPGEVVEADIVEKKKDYSIAEVQKIIRSSEDRVQPDCDVFGVCGGCQYQYIRYQKQIKIKEDILLDCLRRIGKIEIHLDASLYDRPWFYRKRAQFKVDREGRVGFYRPMSHRVVEFSSCKLLCNELNNLLLKLKSVALPDGIREIHAFSGDTVILDIKGHDIQESQLEPFMKLSNVGGVCLNGKPVSGDSRICLMLDDIFYFVSAGAFFQSNWRLNQRLVKFVQDYIKNISPERVLDLYAGGGNFSLPLSKVVAEVIAAEENPVSFQDALYNIEFNDIKNVRFKNKRVESLVVKKAIDVVITDPPRVGMTKDALRKLLDLSPQWIIYVSCNPSTLARDLGRLSEHYQIESVRLVDMFAQTYHIESVSILKRREGN
ncbi:MAG: class I SAM-dependent RNA methyltransferase [Nitrospirae bacterium]|nr:class I SAM-dependent RNA methyltransferase [Nitrospirota bacterium]